MGSFEPTPQIPQKHGIFGTFPRNRAELGCRSKTEDIVTDCFIPHGLSAKRKSVTMILPIKNEGIFIVTLVLPKTVHPVECDAPRDALLISSSFVPFDILRHRF